ncbi:Testis-expressed sequence 264 protein [Liparis tanakae]|uniref:Testis-expressed sequence 264 protein n=1 Tax=Liparis tanakae TaxID=230148 RepID=A0A4Z2J4J9_9TELE|nr:Testis-expressed sequence 264 protein [Liparis tanakae]
MASTVARGATFLKMIAVQPDIHWLWSFQLVPGPQCRCAVGSILNEGENKADKELLKSYETSGFKVFSFPEVTHVVTTSFPHRTFFSVLLGIRRVYPQLQHYIKKHLAH